MARKEHLYIRLGEELKEAYQEICLERETTMAQKARDLILSYVEGKNNGDFHW